VRPGEVVIGDLYIDNGPPNTWSRHSVLVRVTGKEGRGFVGTAITDFGDKPWEGKAGDLSPAGGRALGAVMDRRRALEPSRIAVRRLRAMGIDASALSDGRVRVSGFVDLAKFQEATGVPS
jgi:hypothetical protein